MSMLPWSSEVRIVTGRAGGGWGGGYISTEARCHGVSESDLLYTVCMELSLFVLDMEKLMYYTVTASQFDVAGVLEKLSSKACPF